MDLSSEHRVKVRESMYFVVRCEHYLWSLIFATTNTVLVLSIEPNERQRGSGGGGKYP
jgi:hypothetical protein